MDCVRRAEQARRNEPAVVARVLSQTRNIPRRERHDSAESYGTIGTCMWWKVVSYYWAVRDQPYRQFRPKLLTFASFENFAGIMEKIGNIRGITYIRRCAINPTLLPRDRFRPGLRGRGRKSRPSPASGTSSCVTTFASLCVNYLRSDRIRYKVSWRTAIERNA